MAPELGVGGGEAKVTGLAQAEDPVHSPAGGYRLSQQPSPTEGTAQTPHGGVDQTWGSGQTHFLASSSCLWLSSAPAGALERFYSSVR